NASGFGPSARLGAKRNSSASTPTARLRPVCPSRLSGCRAIELFGRRPAPSLLPPTRPRPLRSRPRNFFRQGRPDRYRASARTPPRPAPFVSRQSLVMLIGQVRSQADAPQGRPIDLPRTVEVHPCAPWVAPFHASSCSRSQLSTPRVRRPPFGLRCNAL